VTPTAILLLLTSAVTHAGWNLLGKRENPTTVFFLQASLLGSLCFSPFIFLYRSGLPFFPLSAWVLLILTGLFQAVYYYALASAYRKGDLSIAYPLARSLPVFSVTIIALLLGFRNQLSGQFLVGIILVVAGCLLVPMKLFSDFSLKNYMTPVCLMALIASLGTAGYSTIDDAALRQLRTATQSQLTTFQVTMVYTCLEGLISTFWLGLMVLVNPKERDGLFTMKAANLPNAFLMGAGIHLAYSLVLVSMAFVRNVSYVVAFRQLSILFGTLLGVSLLKEPAYRPKLVGVVVTFLGLVLVGTG
jgi:drug/metabolite transporter (DMT)-like permease